MIEGKPSGKDVAIGIVVSRFNSDITDRLLQGAFTALKEAKVSKRKTAVVAVPGAFEIPSAAQALAEAGKVDAIVCLGAVIRGETEHFTHVAAAAREGCLRVGLDHRLPVTFGVLTTETTAQALERSGGKLGNKGYEAALDAVEMANLLRRIGPRKRR